jgi:hypothetical protein
VPDLSSSTPAATYQNLLQAPGGLAGGAARQVEDGAGNPSALRLSANGVSVGTGTQTGLLTVQANSPTSPACAAGVSGSHAANIDEWYSGGTLVFALGAAGELKTSQAESSTTLGALVGRVPVYNVATGALLGYLPLYAGS